MFNKSETIAKVAKALVAFSKKEIKVAKDGTNSDFASSYAKLPDILDAIRGPLAECGLAVMQFPGIAAGVRISVETIIMHDSGEFLSMEGALPIDTAQNAHAGASGITYLRRYALLSSLALPDVDDDGNAASDRGDARREEDERRQERLDRERHDARDRDRAAAESSRQREQGEPEAKDKAADPLAAFPAIKDEPWARFKINFGKNNGLLLGELDDDRIAGYTRADVLAHPAVRDNKPFLAALDQWKAFKARMAAKAAERSAANPATPEERTAAKASKAGAAKAAETPAGTPAPKAEETLTPEQIANRKALAKKNLPKRPPSAETTAAAAETPAEPKEAATPSPDTAKSTPEGTGGAVMLYDGRKCGVAGCERPVKRTAVGWRCVEGHPPAGEELPTPETPAPVPVGDAWKGHVLPIGKVNKGKKLGDLPLADLEAIKAQYLDKRQWDMPGTLAPYDAPLKVAVEAGILALTGSQGPAPFAATAAGQKLVAEVLAFTMEPDEFLAKMKELGKIAEEVTDLGATPPEIAEALLADWKGTLDAFDNA